MEKRTSTIKWQTFGHKSQKALLEGLLTAKKTAGAHIFSGPAHIGKTAVAIDFARAVLCQFETALKQRPCGNCPACRLDLNLNPDLELIDQDEAEIKIETARGLQKKFSLKAYGGASKVAVIANADNLNLEATNALLKFLEEPDEQTIIILTTSRPRSLPQTALSRARELRFSLPDEAAVESFYSSFQTQTASQAAELRRLCGASLGLAHRAFASHEFAASLLKASADLASVLSSDTQGRLEFASETKDMDARELKSLFLQWLTFLEGEIRSFYDSKSLAIFARRAGLLLEAIKDLERNLNKKLVVDNLLLNL